MSVRPLITDLQARVSKDIVGQEAIVESLVVGMLSNGNLLVEGLPGLAKTRAIKSLAGNIEGDFSRIQFTPDITAFDIVGRTVFYKAEDAAQGEDAGGMFRFEKGPIFNNIVLADEVNRAPPRAQNALLEAMEERQVTAAGSSHKVPDLFMVMATMNPAGQEGTFAMPEAQMDRFLMHVTVDYPKEAAEMDIIRLVRAEQSQAARGEAKDRIERVLTSQDTIFAARAEIDKITVPPEIEQYMVDLIFCTRYPQRYTYELKSFIRVRRQPARFPGPRSLAPAHRPGCTARTMCRSITCSRCCAPCCATGLFAESGRWSIKITADDILGDVIEMVKLPAAVI